MMTNEEIIKQVNLFERMGRAGDAVRRGIDAKKKQMRDLGRTAFRSGDVETVARRLMEMVPETKDKLEDTATFFGDLASQDNEIMRDPQTMTEELDNAKRLVDDLKRYMSIMKKLSSAADTDTKKELVAAYNIIGDTLKGLAPTLKQMEMVAEPVIAKYVSVAYDGENLKPAVANAISDTPLNIRMVEPRADPRLSNAIVDEMHLVEAALDEMTQAFAKFDPDKDDQEQRQTRVDQTEKQRKLREMSRPLYQQLRSAESGATINLPNNITAEVQAIITGAFPDLNIKFDAASN